MKVSLIFFYIFSQQNVLSIIDTRKIETRFNNNNNTSDEINNNNNNTPQNNVNNGNNNNNNTTNNNNNKNNKFMDNEDIRQEGTLVFGTNKGFYFS